MPPLPRRCPRVPWRMGAILALALAVVLLLPACGPERLDAVPEPLLGRWSTDAPRYEGRWLEVRPDALAWGVRELELDRHPIEEIERVAGKEGGEEYRLHYTESEGFPAELRIRWAAGPPARIRLDSREYAWRRVSTR